MRWLFLTVLIWLTPAMGLAGAWPRGDGKFYIYTSFVTDPVAATQALKYGYAAPYELSIYAEYGLTDRWTLGFDGLQDTELTGGSTAILFATRSIGAFERHRFAGSIGVGWHRDAEGAEDFTARLGAHWGLGFERAWISADLWGVAALGDTAQSGWKADFTYGRRLGKRFSLVGQVQSGQFGGDPYVKLVPKAGLTFGKDSQMQIELGYVHGVANDDTRKALLGFSHSF